MGNMKNEKREGARKWAKDNLPQFGKIYIVNNYPIEKLTYYRSDVKSITGKPHIYSELIFIEIPNLPEILSKSKYLGSSPDDGTHKEVLRWYYFLFEIKNTTSYFNIMKTKKGEFRIYSISDERGFDINKIKTRFKDAVK